MIGVRPDKLLFAKIKVQAKKENRKLGPMVIEIIKRWFEAEDKKGG